MAKKRDWYPRALDRLRAWAVNFKLRRPDFEAKYPILATRKADLDKACDWLVWWIDTMTIEDDRSQQLTKYFRAISGNDPNAEVPSTPTWSAPPGMPAEADTGIEVLFRDVRRETVNYANYATADGEGLGFEPDELTETPVEEMTPSFTAKTLAAFQLQVTFRLLGFDALKFQYRYKGGDWNAAGVGLQSPAVLTIPPSTPGTAEQVELRASFLDGNDEVGNWTDAKATFIAP